jgi:hypothetical protein
VEHRLTAALEGQVEMAAKPGIFPKADKVWGDLLGLKG